MINELRFNRNEPMIQEQSSVGRAMPSTSSQAKATGQADFGDDLRLKGLLVGKVLRSPHPRARVLSVDTAKARAVPGVIAVISGQDVAGLYGAAIMDQPILNRDEVRFVGEPVAAVAAVDKDAAAQALDLIKVQYESLPPVTEALAALDPESLLIHPGLQDYQCAPGIFILPGTNCCNHFRLRKGDPDKALARAAHVFSQTFSTHKTQHASLEPHQTTAQAEPSGRVRLWTNTQTPFVTRKVLAKLFGLANNQVQVTVTRLGGGFGGKAYPKLEPLAVALAQRTGGRPVRLLHNREEEFSGNTATRHPVTTEVTTGLDRQGRILARRVKLIFDTGAYADIGPRVCRNASFSSPGPYVIPNVAVDGYCVYTNTTPASAMRGLGIPQVTWAVESHTDFICRELELDPLEFRLKNAVEEGSPSATGQILHSVGLKETLRRAGQAIGLDKKRPPGVGRGIACGHKSTVSPSASACVVRVNEDGTLQLLTSSVDMGQGSETVLAQILAEELGIDPTRVRVVPADTDTTPYDMATVSSRSTFFMGNAIRDAAIKLKELIFETAEEILEVDRRDLVFEQGRVHVVGSPGSGFDLADIPQGESAYAGSVHAGKGRPLVAEGHCTVEGATKLDRKTGQGAKPSAFWMYFSQAAEVRVDPATGRIKVLKIASAHDVGRAINPLLLEGQIEGAVMMGLGETLLEEMAHHDGRPINQSFLDYKIPTIGETPLIIPLIIENPHKEGPFGAKGMGEPAEAAIGAAINNALADALGVQVQDLPITRERVIMALKRAAGG